ncbi:MAG TPA: YihY/virulence factor BrkB family protein [Mycobacteriales bacterium]|nr:YihY/virulence factor BrkB family protein [Mycobacteriales bacterium]
MLRRTVSEFRADNLGDWAAALTYYGILSIFPALLALVSILGLFGGSASQPLIDNLNTLAPGPARQVLSTALRETQRNQGGALASLIGGVVVALWSASGYVAAFMRAANIAYDVGEWRPAWKTVPLRLAVTAALVVLLAVSAVFVVFTGNLANKAGDVLGVGRAAVLAWDIAKWPVLLLIVIGVFALLYWAAPNVRQPGFRWVTPGSALAVVVWIAASALFAVYIANFGSYNKTYGSLAAVVIFLVWLWLTNTAILLGLQFNAELQRGRAIQAGHPPGAEPYVQPRDTRNRPE